MRTEKTGQYLLVIAFIAACIGAFLLDPIVQDEGYHNFSDCSKMLGVPNCLNVVSNVVFVVVGIIGLIKSSRFRPNGIELFFFAGIVLTGIGSAYYHYRPTTDTLVWDRLPMTLSFMALLSMLITEFVSKTVGRKLFIPLVMTGVISVVYWKFGALHDLRMYVLVQFFPILTIPFMLLYFKSESSNKKAYWFMLACYIIAKLCETYDHTIHEILVVVSGHTLKHLSAALGIFLFARTYEQPLVSEVEL